ncbi:MAG: DNA polymerase III subunit [Candidatus Staskawiczbacteria bacterium]|jgi:DNA polymerase-3 subunit delta'
MQLMVIGHKKQWEFLKNKSELNELSHAYLFTGQEGIGKKLFAKEFAEFIGCKFPDLKIIEKKDDKTGIDIFQIRDAQNFLSYKSYNGGFKIVIVDDAHLMNQEAQSCFLKTLEEPKGNTLLILISSKPDMLLDTIVSRCQTIKFLKPKNLPENAEKSEKEKKILNDLLLVTGADFAEKFKYVKNIDFEKQDALEIVQVLQKYLRQQLLEKLGTTEVAKLKKNLELTEEINNKLIFTNASPKLALEILLMEI